MSLLLPKPLIKQINQIKCTCIASNACNWNFTSLLNSLAISRTKRWNGNFFRRFCVVFWYSLISLSALAPILQLIFVFYKCTYFITLISVAFYIQYSLSSYTFFGGSLPWRFTTKLWHNLFSWSFSSSRLTSRLFSSSHLKVNASNFKTRIYWRNTPCQNKSQKKSTFNSEMHIYNTKWDPCKRLIEMRIAVYGDESKITQFLYFALVGLFYIDLKSLGSFV